MSGADMNPAPHEARIAIVGIGCRTPGARTAAQLWSLVRDGVDAISTLGQAELLAAGVTQATLDSPGYVRRAALLDDIDQFDAGFFGISPEQADLLDPQHRLFFECAAHALEDAGLGPDRLNTAVGVFGGCSISSYLLFNLLPTLQAGVSGATLLAMIGNEKDYLATHLSYLFGLTGPSVGVQSACSTSLAAVHLACQSLLSGECDIALAGGASVRVPQRVGYTYEPGSIVSPSGYCRSFDAGADGTVFGSGAGVVVLRRLDDALRDGDRIYSVILGSAMNNDGNRKAGFSAPSVDGQASVIAEALAVAGVAPASIGLIEAHGTGTPIGDPIEFKALSEVFRGGAPGSVALACVKASVGHLETAAGVTGLIAASMALRHAQLPALAHFERANPMIDIDASPFALHAHARPWATAGVRRAGVSSFGIGGSNVHLVLEQAPPAPVPGAAAPAWTVVCASARSAPALSAAVTQLVGALEDATDLPAIARASTYARRAYEYRVAVAASSIAQARTALTARAPQRTVSAPKLALLFDDPLQARPSDRYLEAWSAALGRAFPRVQTVLAGAAQVVPGLGQPDAAAGMRRIVLQYALFEQLREWGIRPAICAGTGLGELVAGAASGLLSWPAVLRVLADVMEGRHDTLRALAALAAGRRPALLLNAASGVVQHAVGAAYLDALAGALARPALPSTQALLALGATLRVSLGHATDTGADSDDALYALGESADLTRDPCAAMMELLASLHEHGLDPDWRAVMGSGARAPLPLYPFQRRRHWREAAPRESEPDGFPGCQADTPLARRMLCATLYPHRPHWLGEHRVNGEVVLPAAAYASLAVAAGLEQIGALTIAHPTLIRAEGTAVHTLLTAEGEVHIHVQVDGQWRVHARAEAGAAAQPLGRADLAALTQRCATVHDVAQMQQRMRDNGLELGPSFQRVSAVRSGADQALARLRDGADLAAEGMQLHPAVLDAAFQALAVLVDGSGLGAHLPVSFDSLRLAPGMSSAAAAWCHVQLRPGVPGAAGLIGDIAMLDEHGAVLLKVDGLACRPAGAGAGFERHLYVPVWVRQPYQLLYAAPGSMDHYVGPELGAHLAALPGLDQLCTAYVAGAFGRLGVPFVPGQRALLPDTCSARLAPLWPRLWRMLEEDGVVDAGHTVLRRPQQDAAALFAALRVAHPHMATELGMLARCGAALAEVLTGAADPLPLLFTRQGEDDAPALYARSNYAGALNALAAATLAPLIEAARHAGRGLRVLEIGGGTGGTTGHLLPLLAGQGAPAAAADAGAAGANYLFTDISPAFLTAAQARFNGTACLGTALLDIEHDPVGQGIEAGMRDLVIAANVLHATGDLARTIANVRRTLAPGGWLLLIEGLHPSRWLDLTFALTDGWWKSTDLQRRADYPFLDQQGWRDLLEEQGFEAVQVHTPGPGRLADQGVIVARRSFAPLDDAATGLTALASPAPCAAALAWLQASAAQPRRLLATQGGQAVFGWEQPDPDQASVAGLARAAALEQPGSALRTVDLDPLADDPAAALAIEAALDDGETDTAWRNGERYVLRLQRAGAVPALPPVYQLAAAPAAGIDALAAVPATRAMPAAGEVEIQVLAAGVNFKDVLTVMGALAPRPGASLGGECAGVVSRVGPGVRDLVAGQAVVALAGGSFASHVVVPAVRAQAMPPGLTFAQAAVLPIAAMTAWHVLRELTPLAPGQRVLIHAASGGVGLHCVALALAAGAEVVATAGSSVKRAYLRRLGVAHVFDSRSSAFAGQVRALGGVDLVINSLSGAAIEAGLSVLRAGGHFVEIGRANIWSAEQVARAWPQVDYRIVALDQIDDAEGARLLSTVLAAHAAGQLAAMPITRFPMAQAALALRQMQQARHIGRLVLCAPQPFRFRARSSYLITGGLGGLGLAVAQWAVEQGARHLVLAGRSVPGPTQDAAIETMRARGAHIDTELLDVADDAAVAALCASFGRQRPALAAVFHAAGMLADAPLREQDAASLARVMAAKLGGARNLARHTAGLDALVFFSSAAGLLGSAGQANHAAANAALDAFARQLHAQGVAALTINWGPWAEIGAAAARGVGRRLEGSGMGQIAPREGLAALGWMLDHGLDRVAMLPIDWNVFGQRNGAPLAPLFAYLAPRRAAGAPPVAPAPAASVAPPAPAQLALSLAELAPARRGPWLESLVADEVRRMVGGAEPAVDRALTDLGLDSLLAIELRNRLGTLAGKPLPATLIFDHPSVRALAAHLLTILADGAVPTGAPAPSARAPLGPARADPARAAASLSAEQVMALDADGLDAVLRALQTRHLKKP